jgi:beta-1,4-mannosyltransferase
MKKSPPRVCVVVQGDIGRSPRMQYHVRSLLRNGFSVDFVGVAESALVEELQHAPLLTVHALRGFFIGTRLLLLAPLKALWMLMTLLFALLWSVKRCDVMLVQNPPSIPTLAVCVLVCWLRRTKLVIDWHNFGFTILAMRVKSPLLQVTAMF